MTVGARAGIMVLAMTSHLTIALEVGAQRPNDGGEGRRGTVLKDGLRLDPIELLPIIVTVSPTVMRLRAVGYYERKENGFGHFLERREILERAAFDQVDRLRRLPRVHAVDGVTGGTNPGILFRSGGGFCRPTLYLDGAIVARGGSGRRAPLRPDDWVDAEDLEAIEVYTGPASVPMQYQAFASCGVILIWTHHTPLRRRGRSSRSRG